MFNGYRLSHRVLPGFVLWAVFTAAGAIAAQSPFVPSGKPDKPISEKATNADLAALQLSGISALGPELRFNLVNPRTKKSFWVRLNGTVSGFTVTAYDQKTSAVVVEHGGSSRRITLRRPTFIAAAQPAAVQTPLKPPEPYTPIPDTVEGVDEIKDPKTPEEIKQAEYEARMLVSDLLQISMQERERQRLLREQQQNEQQ